MRPSRTASPPLGLAVRFQCEHWRRMKAISIKPILWGLCVALVGMLVSALVLHFWMPAWTGNVDYSGLDADGIIEKVKSGLYYSPPYLVFLFIQAVGWFLGGFAAAWSARESLVFHSIAVGVLGTVIFLNVLYTMSCAIIAGLGGVTAVVMKSNQSAQPTR